MHCFKMCSEKSREICCRRSHLFIFLDFVLTTVFFSSYRLYFVIFFVVYNYQAKLNEWPVAFICESLQKRYNQLEA